MPAHEAAWCTLLPRVDKEQLSTEHSRGTAGHLWLGRHELHRIFTRSPKQAAFRVAIPRASDSLLMRLPSMAACFSFLHKIVLHQISHNLGSMCTLTVSRDKAIAQRSDQQHLFSYPVNSRGGLARRVAAKEKPLHTREKRHDWLILLPVGSHAAGCFNGIVSWLVLCASPMANVHCSPDAKSAQ